MGSLILIWQTEFKPVVGLERDGFCQALHVQDMLHEYHSHNQIDLVWFYGISSIVGYLILNLVYSYMLDVYVSQQS